MSIRTRVQVRPVLLTRFRACQGSASIGCEPFYRGSEMDSNKLLDAVCKKHHIDSNRALARFLEIDRTRVTAYRAGRRKLDTDACIAVAKALDMPVGYVLAVVQAERAKRTAHRREWQKVARTMRVAAGALVLGCGFLGSLPAPANDQSYVTDCILCKRKRRTPGRGLKRKLAGITRYVSGAGQSAPRFT